MVHPNHSKSLTIGSKLALNALKCYDCGLWIPPNEKFDFANPPKLKILIM